MIDEQIRTFDESHQRHFIDMYIAKMRNSEETFSCNEILNLLGHFYSKFNFLILYLDDQLILTCIDFAFPALSALSTTVTFLIQKICHDPDIQYKIQSEIDQVVGEGRAPTLDDRNE